MSLKIPVPVQIEAVCIIEMEGSILETDLKVVGRKLGCCVFNAIFGNAGCEIPHCFLFVLENNAVKVIILIT